MVVTDTAPTVDFQVTFTAMVSLVPFQDAGNGWWPASPFDWRKNGGYQKVNAWPCLLTHSLSPKPTGSSNLGSFNLHQPPDPSVIIIHGFCGRNNLSLTAKLHWLLPDLPGMKGSRAPHWAWQTPWPPSWRLQIRTVVRVVHYCQLRASSTDKKLYLMVWGNFSLLNCHQEWLDEPCNLLGWAVESSSLPS